MGVQMMRAWQTHRLRFLMPTFIDCVQYMVQTLLVSCTRDPTVRLYSVLQYHYSVQNLGSSDRRVTQRHWQRDGLVLDGRVI